MENYASWRRNKVYVCRIPKLLDEEQENFNKGGFPGLWFAYGNVQKI